MQTMGSTRGRVWVKYVCDGRVGISVFELCGEMGWEGRVYHYDAVFVNVFKHLVHDRVDDLVGVVQRHQSH